MTLRERHDQPPVDVIFVLHINERCLPSVRKVVGTPPAANISRIDNLLFGTVEFYERVGSGEEGVLAELS